MLLDYLKSTGQTQAGFAAKAGVNQSTIHRLCYGEMMPSLAIALKIEKASEGKISLPQLLASKKKKRANS